jgi:hypothetical protein
VSKQRETEWQRRVRRERERAEHVAEHGPACQLCGNVPRRGLDQDHDHKTGLTRGWLCHRCNRALQTWVTPEWLILAAIYLAWGAGEAASMRASIEHGRANGNGATS